MSAQSRAARRRQHYRGESGRVPDRRPVPSLGRCPQSGKIRYLDEATADRAVAWQQAHPAPDRPVPIRSYECALPLCNAWHITSKERKT